MFCSRHKHNFLSLISIYLYYTIFDKMKLHLSTLLFVSIGYSKIGLPVIDVMFIPILTICCKVIIYNCSVRIIDTTHKHVLLHPKAPFLKPTPSPDRPIKFTKDNFIKEYKIQKII